MHRHMEDLQKRSTSRQILMGFPQLPVLVSVLCALPSCICSRLLYSASLSSLDVDLACVMKLSI